MWKSVSAILTILGIISVAAANDLNSVSQELKSIQYEQETFIIMVDGEQFYATGLALDQNVLAITKWRVSTNDMWKNVSRSIAIDRIAKIEFQSHQDNHSRHGMHFLHRTWMWGGVMILIMLTMITGGMM